MFVLLVLFVMIITGTVAVSSLGTFYAQRFADNMDAVFADEMVAKDLRDAAQTENAPESIANIIEAYADAGRLGINQNRNYFIFNAKTGECLDGSADYTIDTVLKTENLLAAMNGSIGKKVNSYSAIMDYAYPIHSDADTSYVVYITDNKDEVTDVSQSIISVVFQSLLWGVAISLVLGIFISRTITQPIVDLTRRAEKLASGEETIEVMNTYGKKADDEIGILADTFSYMSGELIKNIREMDGEKTKLSAILENLTDGVIAFDTDGKILHINPVAANMLSIAEPSLVDFNTLMSDVGINLQLGDIMYLKKRQTVEHTITLHNQVIKAFFAVFTQTVEKTTKKIGGIVVALQDITKLQRLDDARREFVANVSHELRTPITTIKTYSETMLDSKEEGDPDAHFLSTINSEADRMTRIIKDLLTLSKLDHGKDTLKKTRIDLREMLDNIVEKMGMAAKKQDHTLTFVATTELPTVMGDRDQLERVFTNLINNALKYTPDGGVIEVFAGHLYNEVYVKVKDNGIGIPKKDLARIFERFYRVDKARTRAAGGTGLGLAIAKEIVEAHGGKIQITSEPEVGTEVMLTLPAKRRAPRKKKEASGDEA